jgi:hypothetical protein
MDTTIATAQFIYPGDTIIDPRFGELLVTHTTADGESVKIEADGPGGRAHTMTVGKRTRFTIAGL